MTLPAKRTHAEIYALLESIDQRLGHEAEDGKSGTGLTGRVMRTETKVLAYDRLKERAIGGFTALCMATAVLWWLTKDKWASLFGVHGG